jgi:hypothetical protein
MSVVAAAVIGSAVVGGAVAMNGQKQQGEIANRQMDQNEQLQAQNQAIEQRQLDLSERNQDVADEYNTYNKTVFRPLETGLVSEAANAGSATEQEIAAGKAGAAVQHTSAQSREAASRNLARMGISANSGRALAVNANLDAQTALGSAAAQNTARDAAKQLGWAKRMDAASLGRNLPSAQATSASLANQGLAGAANTGIGTANVLTSANNSAMQNSILQNTSNMQGLGSAAGMALKYGAGTSTTGPGFSTNLTPMQTLNNQFTTTNAPWSQSAAFDNPSGM